MVVDSRSSDEPMLITSSGDGESSSGSGSVSSLGLGDGESGVEIANAAMDVHSESNAGSLTFMSDIVRISFGVPTLK